MEESRTKMSLINARVSLVYYVILLFIGFFSRKVFYEYLGSEILGLNTTASNILGVLNLAELGVGTSVSYFLFKPLFDDNQDRISKIICFQGWIYRKIAYVIIVFSILLMMFFPLIFEKSPLPLFYAYATFCTLLFCSLLGYFVNYRQILLAADQKNYKIQRVMQSTVIVTRIVQIYGISHCSYPFALWVSTEIVNAICQAFLLNRTIRKEYPWLNDSVSQGKRYFKEMPEIFVKTKQVFYHKIASIVLQKSSPIILYAFTSLTIVAYYGNYIVTVCQVATVISIVFSSSSAAVGNLVASNDKDRMIRVFWELFDSRFCVALIAMIACYILTNPFITIWLGEKYLLSDTFLIIFIAIQFIMIVRTTVDTFISAHGLFQDIYAPLVEAAINIGLSILFGLMFGIEGIMLGVLSSLIIVVCIWKPYFLFTQGLKISIWKYYIPVFIRVIVSVGIIYVTKIIVCMFMDCWPISSFITWITNAVITTIIVSIISSITFIAISQGFRDFINRLVGIIKFKL